MIYTVKGLHINVTPNTPEDQLIVFKIACKLAIKEETSINKKEFLQWILSKIQEQLNHSIILNTKS